MPYQLGGDLPDLDVPDGTNLMIAGPPMSGKYDLFLGLLQHEGDNVVVISTQRGAEEIRRDIEDRWGNVDDEEIAIVDCVSKLRGGDVKDDTHTRYVQSPKNLTRIGVAFTDFYTRWEGERTRVGFHALSNLVMYTDLETVYKFLQVLNGQVYNAGWLSVMVYDPSMHDERVTHTLQDPFDGIIDTRENDGRREFRIRGLESTPTDWTGF